MSRVIRVVVVALLVCAASVASAKKPPRAAALKAAKAFVAELVAIEQGENDDVPNGFDRFAKLAKLVSVRFSVVVGYEGVDEEGDVASGSGQCAASVDDPSMFRWAAQCLRKNSVGFAPSDDQWSDWSKKAMKTWSWQIDDSGIARVAKTARVFALHAPETMYVVAVVTDDDGTARVAAVWSGMTYD